MRAALTEALFPFLSGLSKDARREFGALVPGRAKPHQHLLRRGDVAGGAYLVLGGSLRVYYISGEGREATLYTVEPGGTCILALTVAMNDGPYPAWVDAGPAGGQYLVVSTPLVGRLLDGERAFREFVFGALSGRIFDLMRTLEEVGFNQIQQRVARYLMKHRGPDACVRVTQASIAAELGTAREVIFRALRSLSARSMVETGRQRVRIVDAAGLVRVASGEDARPNNASMVRRVRARASKSAGRHRRQR
jgi:CRP/FNR family transcriptional regulator